MQKSLPFVECILCASAVLGASHTSPSHQPFPHTEARKSARLLTHSDSSRTVRKVIMTQLRPLLCSSWWSLTNRTTAPRATKEKVHANWPDALLMSSEPAAAPLPLERRWRKLSVWSSAPGAAAQGRERPLAPMQPASPQGTPSSRAAELGWVRGSPTTGVLPKTTPAGRWLPQSPYFHRWVLFPFLKIFISAPPVPPDF